MTEISKSKVLQVLQGNTNDREPVVEFVSVDYSHPNGTVALRNIILSVSKGELLAILGTNGAGKSTLVRHMNGLIKPTHGTVRVFGEDTRLTTAARLSRRVGVVFQNPSNQLFAQSVKKEIEFALHNFGYPPNLVIERTNWALKTFSLDEYAERPPMELSGGEKKRLCIALVLAWDPDIIVFDEPTVGQDSEQKEKLSKTIESLLSQKKTIILVTHDVEFAWPLQPRVVLMAQGRIVADGPAQISLSDQEELREANVLPPKLVEFSKLMNWGTCPSDALQARNLILESRIVDG